jgi:hypothetical protein
MEETALRNVVAEYAEGLFITDSELEWPTRILNARTLPNVTADYSSLMAVGG